MVWVPLRMGTGYRATPHGSTCMGTPQETENNTASGSGILGWESGVLLGLEDWMPKTDTSKSLICVPHLGSSDWHIGCLGLKSLLCLGLGPRSPVVTS